MATDNSLVDLLLSIIHLNSYYCGQNKYLKKMREKCGS